MKWLGGRRVRWLGGLMALAMTLVSCLANSVQTLQDKQKVANMTDRMKTVCVGRFLIDLPIDAQVHLGRAFVGGFDVTSTVDESDAEFEQRLRDLEEELAGSQEERGRPRLEAVKAIASGLGRGKIFMYDRRRVPTMRSGRLAEADVVSVRSIMRFDGLTISARADRMAPDVGLRLEGLLRRMRPLALEELPEERGFCLERAIVLDPFEEGGNDSVVMFAGLPGHPDLNIAFSTMAATKRAPSLLERNAKSADSEPFFMRMAFTNLRERQRNINGLAGEELLMRVREPNFTTGYSFQWEMSGKPEDDFPPLLTLEMDSGANPVAGGRPVQSTLSEEAMVALWERITGSIRLRPTEPAKSLAPSPALVAVGTSALAGEACPETGWWQCGDGGGGVGVFGGERQFLRKGQRMPQALLLPPASLWQRLRGMQPSYENRKPTPWTLCDKRGNARLAPPAGLALALPGADAGILPSPVTPGARIAARIDTPIDTPIGSVAKTGAACPASGWWRCEDSHALDGTRWFAAGSVLPAASFRTQAHGRGAGHPETIHRRSAWRLLRHAEAPMEADGPNPTPGLPDAPASSAS